MSESSRRVCAFCGQKGKLSKEHILSEWIQGLISKSDIRTSHTTTLQEFGQTQGREPLKFRHENKMKSGDPLSQTLRIVCRDCNQTWISRIVNATRPLLEMLLIGEWPSFSQQSVDDLALWLCLTTIVFEYADLITKVVPPTDLTFLQQSRKVPPNWSMYIGINHDLDTKMYHRGIRSNTESAMQLTFLSVGRLCAVVLSAYSSEMDLNKYELSFEDKLTRLWSDPTIPILKPKALFGQGDWPQIVPKITDQIMTYANERGIRLL